MSILSYSIDGHRVCKSLPESARSNDPQEQRLPLSTLLLFLTSAHVCTALTSQVTCLSLWERTVRPSHSPVPDTIGRFASTFFFHARQHTR